jgi:predicted neuraminidase
VKRRVLPLLFFVVVLAISLPRMKALPEASFAIPATIPAATSTLLSTAEKPPAEATALAQPTSQLLPRAGSSAHAVTLTQLENGKLMAAWFAGSREGAADVAIVGAIFDKGVWSSPQTITDRRTVQRDTRRLIRKLGNPVLWRAPDNVLHLWFVSVSYGGWAGSAVNHMQSSDAGRHWSPATRIVTSPFWNISTLVRNPPLALKDGGIALPAYHEFLAKRPEWLRLDNHYQLIDKARIPYSTRTLQPATVALDEHLALALMRDSGPLHRIHAARSNDAGGHWLPAIPSEIANPDAAITLVRLADGSLLLACNPLEANRNQIALLRSLDEGRHWSAPRLIEQGEVNDEFSYPALLQDRTGNVHLAYTWKRQTIRHVTLSPTEIEAIR